jgi:pyruvoyl-dependent arginine decarboxylase (PvlArgDC)
VAAAAVRAEEGCTSGSLGQRMTVVVAVGAAGGAAGRGSVPQAVAVAAPVDADKGSAGGSNSFD